MTLVESVGPTAPWNMQTQIAFCLRDDGSVVTGKLYPQIRSAMPPGDEYVTPNASINPLDTPSCKYDVIINPVEYGSKWVALEADAAPRTACEIEGGCRNPEMALGNSHFCVTCSKGPLHALCSLAITGDECIFACSVACFQAKIKKI